jgi:putative polyhydroxyalkanoate system protein
MPDPISVDVPHKLCREAARARIASGIGKLADMFPGGGTLDQRWDGDTLHFTLSAMGQKVASRIAVFDQHVHCEIDLPPMLALFAGKIREKLAKEAPKLLE